MGGKVSLWAAAASVQAEEDHVLLAHGGLNRTVLMEPTTINTGPTTNACVGSWLDSRLIFSRTAPHRKGVFPSADRADDPSERHGAVKDQSWCLHGTAEQRVGEILPCTCQPGMMTDFLWAGETIIVSSWTETDLRSVRVLASAAGNLTPLLGPRITWAYVEFGVHLAPHFPRKKQKFLKV